MNSSTARLCFLAKACRHEPASEGAGKASNRRMSSRDWVAPKALGHLFVLALVPIRLPLLAAAAAAAAHLGPALGAAQQSPHPSLCQTSMPAQYCQPPSVTQLLLPHSHLKRRGSGQPHHAIWLRSGRLRATSKMALSSIQGFAFLQITQVCGEEYENFFRTAGGMQDRSCHRLSAALSPYPCPVEFHCER